MKTISRKLTLLLSGAIKQNNKLESTTIMKPIHKSPFRRRIGPLAISSAVLLLALAFVTSRLQAGGTGNTATGDNALDSNTTGDYNTADGFNALTTNTIGGRNTGVGSSALFNNGAGSYNTGIGVGALFSNLDSSNNTAVGAFALWINTGSHNTANGANALYNNTTASYNTADGNDALYRNTSGAENTATGYRSLYSNLGATRNTADGFQALYTNRTGENNTAVGHNTLAFNATGGFNSALGAGALYSNSDGTGNTATGFIALSSNIGGSYNTAEGYGALFHNTGSTNVGLGYNAGSNLTTGTGNVCIGAGVLGLAGESNTTRIRNIYSSVASGRAVYVNSNNKIGTLASSRRFKDEIKPMDKASETILALKPVTFRYKKEIEPNGAIMFGLIAEEVEKLAPELVTRNAEGEVETVRYEAVNAMLLNEFLKEHRRVEEQGCKMGALETTIARQQKEFRTTVEQQQKEIAALTTALKAQAAQIQKVSDQLRTAKPTPLLVSNQE